MFVHKFPVGMVADYFDEVRKDDEAKVVIFGTFAWIELHRLAGNLVPGAFPGEVGTLVLGDARSVREQLADGDFIPCTRGSGFVFADGVVEVDLSLLNEEHDTESGESLRARANSKEGMRGDRMPFFGVCKAKAFMHEGGAINVDSDGKARDMLFSHLIGDDGINLPAQFLFVSKIAGA